MNSLQDYRRMALMTQPELSKAIGAHDDYINRLETYNRKPGKAYSYAIVKVLNERYTKTGLGLELTIDDLVTCP